MSNVKLEGCVTFDELNVRQAVGDELCHSRMVQSPEADRNVFLENGDHAI